MSFEKLAQHAEDRLRERAPGVDPAVLDDIRSDLRGMKLPPGSYHLPLHTSSGVHEGYAVIKTVDTPTGNIPVLATVFSKHMDPPGRPLVLNKTAGVERFPMDMVTWSGFSDELEKIAEESGGASRFLRPAGYALGGAVLGGLGYALAKKPLRANLKDLLKGGGYAAERNAKIPQSAKDTSKTVADFLRSKGIDPSKAMIGVSGTGGTGKTTLVKGMAEELGMQRVQTNSAGKQLNNFAIIKHVKNSPPMPGYIAEQTHMLNQVDPDKFDVLIRVHKPMDVTKKQILSRGRGAAQMEYVNYDKLDKGIHSAFHNTKGEVFSPAPGIEIKLKPKGGFKADEILDAKIRAMGHDPTGMTRDQKVFAAGNNSKPHTKGIFPYLNKKNVGASVAALSIPAAGAGYLGHRQNQRDQH